MSDSPLAFESIAGLAAKIRSGALSPVTLTEALLERIAALNGRLHAFIAVTRERALAEARAAELALRGGQDLGPLHGIPYAAKDLFDVRGVATGARTLDADDVRAEVGQHHSAERTGAEPGHFDDAQPVKRPGHVVLSCGRSGAWCFPEGIGAS